MTDRGNCPFDRRDLWQRLFRPERPRFEFPFWSNVLGVRSPLPGWPPKGPPSHRSGQRAVVVLQLAVDENVVDALRKLRRFFECGRIHDRSRIENRNVRKKADLNLASTVEMLPLRGHRSDLANCLGKSHE